MQFFKSLRKKYIQTFLSKKQYFDSIKPKASLRERNHMNIPIWGILYTYQNYERFVELLGCIKQIERLGNKVKLICLLENQDIQKELPFYDTIYVSYEDINLVGRIKNRQLKQYLSISFDYFCSFDYGVQNSLLNYLIVKANAKRKIGIYHFKNLGIFDILLKITEENFSVNVFLKNIMYYHRILEVDNRSIYRRVDDGT